MFTNKEGSGGSLVLKMSRLSEHAEHLIVIFLQHAQAGILGSTCIRPHYFRIIKMKMRTFSKTQLIIRKGILLFQKIRFRGLRGYCGVEARHTDVFFCSMNDV